MHQTVPWGALECRAASSWLLQTGLKYITAGKGYQKCICVDCKPNEMLDSWRRWGTQIAKSISNQKEGGARWRKPSRKGMQFGRWTCPKELASKQGQYSINFEVGRGLHWFWYMVWRRDSWKTKERLLKFQELSNQGPKTFGFAMSSQWIAWILYFSREDLQRKLRLMRSR